MASDWREYQEEAAALFRSLDLNAETDVRVNGARTRHDIDVVVTSHHVGFEVRWLVECKYWRKPVSKVHVLALREIVSDVGADRGIILSEAGFQSGAVEAATLTNVRATSLVELRHTASADIFAMRLRDLYDRADVCKKRYWSIPKGKRILLGLRPEAPDVGYSGSAVVALADDLLVKAFRADYPFTLDSLHGLVILKGSCLFATAGDVVAVLEPLISDLEARLLVAEK